MNKGLSFDEISNVYLDLVRFRHDEFVENTKWKADLIVNGSKDFHTILSIFKGIFKSKGNKQRKRIINKKITARNFSCCYVKILSSIKEF